MAIVGFEPRTMDPTDRQPASSEGLFKSLSNLTGTVVGIAHTRLELLTTELQEEVQRAAELVVWAAVALLAAMLALFLGALTVIFIFWDTYRVLAALLMTAIFVVMAIASVLVLRNKLRNKPPMLDETLAELAQDRDRLRRRA